MKITTQNYIDTAMLTSGVTIGLQLYQEIIGMVLLSVQILWITFKVASKIREHVKNKNANGILATLKEFKKELELLKNEQPKLPVENEPVYKVKDPTIKYE